MMKIIVVPARSGAPDPRRPPWGRWPSRRRWSWTWAPRRAGGGRLSSGAAAWKSLRLEKGFTSLQQKEMFGSDSSAFLSFVRCLNAIQTKRLHTFASSCVSATAGQAEKELLCQLVSREWQQSQKSLNETSLAAGPKDSKVVLLVDLPRISNLNRPGREEGGPKVHLRGGSGGWCGEGFAQCLFYGWT